MIRAPQPRPPEAAEHPEPDPLRVPEANQRWFVAHTRPRAEKRMAEYCRRSGLNCYLPLREAVHTYGRRKRSFRLPLFPGYVFFTADDGGAASVRQNRYAAGVLQVTDQRVLVEQLRQIRQALESGDAVEVMPYLHQGRRVRVTGGPFRGLEGLVSRVRGKCRVIINVDIIQQAVALEIDSTLLAPA